VLKLGKRRAGAVLAAICALSAATAVGATQASASSKAAHAATAAQPVPSSQKVSITFVTYLPLISPEAQTVLTKLVSGFEAAHPNITVNVQTSAAASGAGIDQAVEQDEAAGQTPDVVQVVADGLRYDAFGGLRSKPLDQIVGAKALKAEFGGDHPYPKAVANLGVMRGHQYGIPWVLSTPVLFYNATLFKQAGLNPNDPPATWAEVETDSLKIKKATGADGVASCAVGVTTSSLDWCTQAVIRSNGGSVLTANTNNTAFTAPKTVAALATMAKLGKAGVFANVSSAQALQEFGQGKLARYLNSSATQGALLAAVKGHYKLLDAKLPSFSASEPSTPINSGSMLAIASTSPLQQSAAWEWIQWLTSDSAYTQITENIGYAPLRTTLVNDPKYLKKWAYTQSLAKVNLEQLSYINQQQNYPGPNFSQIEALLTNATTQSVFGNVPAAKALAQAQAQAQPLLH
jgi:multiple sugar transport system substrate-binding protein